MNLQNIEIELKFPLLNYEELTQKLKSIAKPEKLGDFQKDIYFNPPHKDFLSKKPVSEWIRLRESKKGFSINYKNWHKELNAQSITCDEFETKVDNIESLKKILQSLNFKELITVEKNRNTWRYKNTEIAIDEVKELGKFIEIEAKGNFSDTKEAKQHLFQVLKEIEAKVGEQDFKGYPYRLLALKGLI